MPANRTFIVTNLSRVEGEGALYVKLNGEQVEHIELNIFEPPRFFESFLRGREVREVPDITARICGICPVAYQMSSCHALEKALGINDQITPEIRRLRRLLYCGEWIESHALHMHLLHAPDFLGYESGVSMAADHREVVVRGLRLKKIGNDLLEILGGRAIHPINVTVGGFYKAPGRKKLKDLLPDLEWGLAASIEATRMAAAFDFPDFTMPYECVALRHPDEYPLNEGRIVSTSGLDIDAAEYEEHFQERQVPHSTALHSVLLPQETSYLVGPLARVNLCLAQLSPLARREADAYGIAWPSRNNFHSIVARGLEMIHAYEEAIEIVKDYQAELAVSRIPFELKPGEGSHATEAPRGLIWHRYRIGDDGLIADAKIVPPTSQNQGQIEDDLRHYVPQVASLDDAEATRRCEHLIRNYDPCISCSTHFIRVTWERT
ncbi:Ni/Fe hydrogenase subunit alpha [Lignipirellula cremea]|uniref:NAD-reducing hydrogenase HoxS subunit beta n=1 Tax=Lignipirellula cremea TaxID=2528010 RepID=A0A518E458_9BACT|nr:Ni/Fe hydrogenase subunit alpha [Lignipirellula cremea]QDU98875.1 NAD-reducing hydrogenase HoxS subunit beta [Lignipirellula cremea]